ncbi:class II aldolase/adducin family protein [Amycolatopsis pithecellobii]|uniref:Class II aldolase/adducin family protein n=1 Tax=Amycolatopsis pithecellobii TaxID=664692 RepID=A0A6N7YYA7_9PSEU|nr:class II aldolase/adducin family protein [Amycolatopsis pithecellobii]MTD56888.1 class II aldolase/adducin family protein [Amycolatopsis pithecellobii]
MTELVEAAHVLARLGLVTAFGHVSVRQGENVLVTPPADLGTVREDELITVPLDATELPAGAPPEVWLHLAIYRRRPDAGAIARAQPEALFVAGAVTDELRPLHGQAAWLGARVPVHPVPRLLRSEELATAAAETLGDSEAIVLRSNGGAALGATPGLAVARMWLLDVACRVWTQAHQGGKPEPLGEDDITAWRAAEGPLLERLWQHLKRKTEQSH